MSNDDTFELSRRKALAGLGTIGVASAGAGMGTSAFFSDTENFSGNTLVAGELDMKVDWEEHYSDWSDDEAEGVGTVSMEPDSGLTGFPSTAPLAEKSVFVEDEQQFMDNTAIEAFPDVDPREAEPTGAADYDGQKFGLLDDDICDVDADLDGVLDSPYRTGGVEDKTVGGAPNPQTTSSGDPLISISDVKPGDFGEVTFSFHICGNPAWVWLTGDLVGASENGHTEPEEEDDDEVFDDDPHPDVDGEYVELLDEIRAAVWYDTGEDGVYGADSGTKDAGEGDNIFGTGETLIPLNGSLRNVLTALENNMFPLDAEPVSEVETGGETGGDFPTVTGVQEESDDLVREVIVTATDDRFQEGAGGGTPRNWQCADYEERIDYIEDTVGSEVLNPDDAPIVAGSSYSGCTTITVNSIADDGSGDITLSSTGPVLVVSVKGGDDGEHVYTFEEPVILNEATFTTPTDADISNVDVCCPVDGGDNGVPGLETGRQCFPNSTTAYIGFEWWLPVDHGNEIQTDSVEFDLGFYTEQCRHNDGTDPQPEGS